MAAEPPVVEERRRTPDRRRRDRRADDRTRFIRTAVAAAIAICGGLVVVFLFFAAIGAVRFRDAAVATLVTMVMATVSSFAALTRRRVTEASMNESDRCAIASLDRIVCDNQRGSAKDDSDRDDND